MKIKDRISVAIPDTSLSDEKGLREKTLKIGKFARTFSIFGVKNIVIYKDPTEPRDKSDMFLLRLILEFLNTPQYLRKTLYPMDRDLSYIGLLPPIRAPQHKNKVKPKDVKIGEIRVGVIHDRNSLINKKDRKRFTNAPKTAIDFKKENYDLYIDVGLDYFIPFLGNGINGEKVVVKFVNSYPELKVIRASGKDLEKLYFGYTLVKVNSLEEYIKKLGEETFVIFTSRYGKSFQTVESQFKENITKFENLLIVFGSPNRGIKELFVNYYNTKNSMYVNIFPNQKTQTIRLEEAILGTLTLFNHFLP
ncbi:MAG TPA: RNA methyltransferase [Nitrososphaeraceae archaeon]|nr:RNA methyltransferase [Nitrososphaeraceae archaeon]